MSGIRLHRQGKIWQPLLDGAWRQRALEAVEAIAASLRPGCPAAAPPGQAVDPSLASGSAGLALLFAYLAAARREREDATAARQWLAQAIQAVSEVEVPASLYGGLSGVAWAAAHLQQHFPDLDVEPIHDEIDAVLLEHLGRSPWPDTYDLIGGLVGFGVYALERGPQAPLAVACLERVIEHLGETAERRPDGIAWASGSEWLTLEVREERPLQYYDLGLAHGIPGIIALLGRACAAGVAAEKARPLLEGGVRWLLAQQEARGTDSFPYRVDPGLPRVPAQLAWRYGDPGVAAALLLAARCAGEPSWERAARAVARRAAGRPRGARVHRWPGTGCCWSVRFPARWNRAATWEESTAMPATLAFVGDVILARGLNAEMARRPAESFWGSALRLLRSADAVIANLECAVTERTGLWQKTPKVFYLRSDPSAVTVLRAARVRCVSLANNHTLDFGPEGLRDTLGHLDAAGIQYAGAGRDLAAAEAPAVIDAAGLKVGIVSFTDNEPAFAAGPNHPGTNYLDVENDPAAVARVERAAARTRQRGAGLVVLSLHWGPNMRRRPTAAFRAFARAAVDHGVDLIHGHSAHLFQGVERYGRGLILYDTGNFLDDFPVDPDFRNDWSFLFLLEADATGVRCLRLVPVRLGYGRVDLAIGAEFEVINERMRSLCSALETPAVRTTEGLEVWLGEGKGQRK
jgi:poly-gamma-glutamate synthesis protein (capsule biosynthesis protein)